MIQIQHDNTNLQICSYINVIFYLFKCLDTKKDRSFLFSDHIFLLLKKHVFYFVFVWQ